MFPNLSKSKNLILGSSLVTAASAVFLGCQLDPYIITAEEQYTRNFIKDFGLIDPDQDWNLAKDATVTVNLGAELCSSVKIYGKLHDKYYLVADLTDLSGTIEVPVDLPESCNDIMVKAKGRKYYGNLGSTINCADMSRGVPDVTYKDDGTAKNPNPALYTNTLNGYTVSVQHTTKGNAKGTEYEKYNDKGAYQYFNTQQISPLISTDIWDKYYSANTKQWTDNTDHSVGLLPESGKFNRESYELENWLNDRKAEGKSIVEDFRISTGDDGSFTIFPYYYGTNLKHELGVYLLDEYNNPILTNNREYNESDESTYTLDDFISFPVFQDRAPGDLQVQAHYDDQITGIRLKNGNPKFELGENYNLQNEVEIERGTGNWMSYQQYLDTYGQQYHSRVAYHFWIDDPAEEKMYQNPDSFARIYNNGIVTPLKLTKDHNKEGIAYANVAIQTKLKNSDEYGAGVGLIEGVEENFTYKVLPPNPIKSIEIAEKQLKMCAGDKKQLNVTLKDKNGNTLPLKDYFDQISVTEWDKEKCYIYKDESTKTIWIEAKGSVHCWPRVYVTQTDFDGVFDYVEVFTSPHHITKEYTGNPDTDVITLHEWQEKYFAPSNEHKEDVTGKIYEQGGEDQGWAFLGYTTEAGGWDTRKLDKDVFKDVDNTYKLRIRLNESHQLVIRGGSWNDLTCEYMVGEQKYTLQPDDDGNKSCRTIAASTFDVLLNDDMINILKDVGLAIQNASNDGVTYEKIELVRPLKEVEEAHDWTATGQEKAANDLAAYYTGKAESKCDYCGNTFNFASITPTVIIMDDAGYGKIHYTVTWEQKGGAATVSKYGPSARSRSTSSREYNPTASFLDRDGTWQDVNSYWSRYLPHQEEVASYPPNVCMLARSRGYDVTIYYGTDEKGDPKPWKGNLGMYLKVVGSYDILSKRDANGKIIYPEERYEKYTSYEKNNTNKNEEEYVVFSQRRFNKAADGASSNQISALSVKHPKSGRTFLTFEDMRLTRNNVTPADFYRPEKSSDRDVNDLIFNITNYGDISNDKESITESETDGEEFSWLWAVEDLGATDDFDFNDMVMKITSVTKNKTVKVTDKDENGNVVSSSSTTTVLYKKVTFTPLCAGGTLPLYVHYTDKDNNTYNLRPGTFKEGSLDYTIDDKDLKEDAKPVDDLKVLDEGACEIHKWFGDYASSVMLNTVTGGYVKAKSCVMYLNTKFTIEGFGNSNGAAQGRKGGLSVSVNDGRALQEYDQIYDKDWEDVDGWAILRPEDGKVSQMFMIYNASNKWRWPIERTHMLTAYPDFKKWVQNQGYGEWFNNGNKECTVPRYDLGETK